MGRGGGSFIGRRGIAGGDNNLSNGADSGKKLVIQEEKGVDKSRRG